MADRSMEMQKHSFVFDKLFKAGIEVVADKAEFNRILRREAILQAMIVYHKDKDASFKSLKRELLTKDEVQILLDWGNKSDDIKYIQYAMFVSTLTDGNGKKLSFKHAEEILGREKLLGSFSRCAFHRTASNENNGNSVYFELDEEKKEARLAMDDAWLSAVNHVGQLFDVIRREGYFKFDRDDEENFKRQISDWQKNNINIAKLVVVGKIPPIMKVLGIADKPIEVQYSTLNKMVNDMPFYPHDDQGHKLSVDDIYAIPSQLADPVMVFKSGTRNDSYVFFTERKDFQNHSILIPLAVNKKKGRIIVNEITSMYGKDNEINFVKKNFDEENLIYADKKRSLDWELSSQVQFLTQRFSYPNSEISILTKERLVNFLEGNSQKLQKFIQNDVVYGFAHEGKIYLNPDVMSSEAALHEYTHLWDAYIQRTDPELWQKGKDLLKDTRFWKDVKRNPDYSDIADDDDLLLSEVHSQICGKMADAVLTRIAERDGSLAKDTVVEWDKECWEYLASEVGFGNLGNVDLKDLRQFLSCPMKDLMQGVEITKARSSFSLSQDKAAYYSMMASKESVDFVRERYAEKASYWKKVSTGGRITPEERARCAPGHKWDAVDNYVHARHCLEKAKDPDVVAEYKLRLVYWEKAARQEFVVDVMVRALSSKPVRAMPEVEPDEWDRLS